MRCEVVAIGTELLLGIIVDTNSSWIGEQLALSGIDCLHQVKVGDNFNRIEDAIRTALSRADAVICCGGLGPTQDDITRDVIARVMGVEMRRDDGIAEKIRRMFAARGRTMSANNLRQADVPIGAMPIAEMPGTAPGLVCPIGEQVIYAVPGVPREMRAMMLGTILPDLRRRAGEAAVIRSRVLRSWGISESGVAELLGDRVEALDVTGNPTIAFQASGIEGIKVRLVAKCADDETAKHLLDEEEAHVRARLGNAVFGVNEQTMETVVLDLLRARGLTVAAVEQVTGGIMASRLTAADETSDVFRGGLVRVGSIDGDAVHAELRAAQNAEEARRSFATSVGLSAVAPDDVEGAAPGTVYLAADVQGRVLAEKVILPPDRVRIRDFAVISLLDVLRRGLAS